METEEVVGPKEVKVRYKSACSGLRYDLKNCVLKTDCVKIDKITPRLCLQERRVPQECIALANEFYECKRQLNLQPAGWRPEEEHLGVFEKRFAPRKLIRIECGNLLIWVDMRRRFRGLRGY